MFYVAGQNFAKTQQNKKNALYWQQVDQIWQNFKSFLPFAGVFSICQKHQTYIGQIVCYWANFNCYKQLIFLKKHVAIWSHQMAEM